MSEWIPKHVVAGTDFSTSSRGAVRAGLQMAALFGARLSVLHVALGGKTPAEGVMDGFLAKEEAPDGVEVIGVIRAGSKVADTLADFVESEEADLLVVGPRAHGFVERHISGGVAQQLVSKTSAATLATAGATEKLETVMVAADRSRASRVALAAATSIAKRSGGKVLAFHALSTRAAGAVSRTDHEGSLAKALVADATAELREAMLAAVPELADVSFELDVRLGSVGHLLPMVVEETTPDMVCMGTAGRRGLSGLLAGNAAGRMIKSLGIPLLIAHPAT